MSVSLRVKLLTFRTEASYAQSNNSVDTHMIVYRPLIALLCPAMYNNKARKSFTIGAQLCMRRYLRSLMHKSTFTSRLDSNFINFLWYTIS